MESQIKDYQKYKWFFTSEKNLVVGGKSALQNDELLKKLKRQGKDYVVMHTSEPGSPFAVILANIENIKPTELEQTAVFTACFSRAWRAKRKKAQVDIFKLSQLYKLKKMKTGMWGIKGKIGRKKVLLGLVLTKQKDKLRAVPEKSVKKSHVLLKIKPGKIDKREMLPKFQVLLEGQISQEELLSALPAGGILLTKK